MIQKKQFQKRIEDFVCEHCGIQVRGTGYRNHCPACFYSKHVDVNPGDREADCGGLMPVVGVELRRGKQVMLHCCQRCGFERYNKVQKDDDIQALAEIITQLNQQ